MQNQRSAFLVAVIQSILLCWMIGWALILFVAVWDAVSVGSVWFRNFWSSEYVHRPKWSANFIFLGFTVWRSRSADILSIALLYKDYPDVHWSLRGPQAKAGWRLVNLGLGDRAGLKQSQITAIAGNYCYCILWAFNVVYLIFIQKF